MILLLALLIWIVVFALSAVCMIIFGKVRMSIRVTSLHEYKDDGV